MKQEVSEHYDALLREGNDPYFDSPVLRAYMNRWDGAPFFQALGLKPEHRVLEIGVGTGRLAAQAAPLCKSFTGVDVAPLTLARAKENLAAFSNVRLLCGDFLLLPLTGPFDRIFSSLTFMHIQDKQRAAEKIAAFLVDGGRVVLSLDKSREKFLSWEKRSLALFPDTPEEITACLEQAGLRVQAPVSLEAAWLLTAEK